MQAEAVSEACLMYRNVTINDLERLARQLLTFMGDIRVCALAGEMGAGKTTLIKAIGHAMDVMDSMSSPTFSIINEYQAGAQTTLYHIDCYRLKSEAEARAVGLEDYFYSGAYCFVEWAELIPSLLPENYVQVNITPEDDTHRTIEFSIHGRKEKDRV